MIVPIYIYIYLNKRVTALPIRSIFRRHLLISRVFTFVINTDYTQKIWGHSTQYLVCEEHHGNRDTSALRFN